MTLVRIAALAILLALLTGCPKLFGKRQSLGRPTDFTLTTFSGEQRQLSSYFGEPLVLNFWAVW